MSVDDKVELMTETKILQLILDKVSKLDQKVDANHKELTGKIDSLDIKLSKRIDRLGIELAELQDDAPTRKEFTKLDRRVTHIEKQLGV